jgi:hypothetical protein
MSGAGVIAGQAERELRSAFKLFFNNYLYLLSFHAFARLNRAAIFCYSW